MRTRPARSFGGARRRPNRPRCGIHRRIEETFFGELCAIICDDGVWDSKAMDDVEEEQHSLLGFDRGDRPSLYPLCKLVYGHVMRIVWSAWADMWVY